MFFWITKVYWTRYRYFCLNHPHKPFNKVGDILETAGLVSITIYSYVLVTKCLYNKVRNNSTIILSHSRTICVKYANNFHLRAILTMVVHTECFAYSFTFIVTRTNAYRIDIPPVCFGLWVNQRITIYFACGCLKYDTIIFTS